MVWYVKEHECDACGHVWTDEHCCACDDQCPNCGRKAIQAHDFEPAGYQGSCGDPNCPDCARPHINGV